MNLIFTKEELQTLVEACRSQTECLKYLADNYIGEQKKEKEKELAIYQSAMLKLKKMLEE